MEHFPSENKGKKYYMPLVYALLIVVGILIGNLLSKNGDTSNLFKESRPAYGNKFLEIVNYLKREYVDTINEKRIIEQSINNMLQRLDPHSFYIPSEELNAVNESLEGNFEGIGIEFNIYQDTIVVVSPISGGPSESLGINSGDRIVKIENKNVAGTGITNKEVIKQLRGPGGTVVNISVLRRGKKELIPFRITRGKIPIFSIDASYMIDERTGYIKINRFAENTFEEYQAAFEKLSKQGIQNLILDLRNNPGGYLQAATLLSDEFLAEEKLIVYTQGNSRERKDYFSTSDGAFEDGNLIVLIDEGSASASEIVSGAVQDWDRGIIIGRKSFGKGLVQDQIMLKDSSAIRLTIARYYTPSGRCIQKPYAEGLEKYQNELEERFEQGLLEHPDTIIGADSLKTKTLVKGRTVYGGGGIMPDIFVPLDTTMGSPFLSEVLNNGILNRFVFNYVDQHRELKNEYKTAENFRKKFKLPDATYDQLISFAASESKDAKVMNTSKSKSYLMNLMTALIARNLWQGEGYYSILNDNDECILKAMQVIREGKTNP